MKTKDIKELQEMIRKVFLDQDISIEAKGIYGYIVAYTDGYKSAEIGWQQFCDELGMSRARFYKHREQLLSKGYIEVISSREGYAVNGTYILK